MKCPHCLVEFHPAPEDGYINTDNQGHWYYQTEICPSCKKAVIFLLFVDKKRMSNPHISLTENKFLIEKTIQVYPKGISRAPCPLEVDEIFSVEYEEACLVIQDSPKASAALSRRCLQSLLREKVGVQKDNLEKEINEAIEKERYPSYIAGLLHALRQVGNFSAHPQKNTSTGEIIEVEPGEAELCLDILESLFDFHFVLPSKIASQKEKINEKLEKAGKPTI